MSSRSRLKKNQFHNSLYLKYLPLLVAACFCFTWVVNTVVNKYPQEIANFLLPQLYLPLLLPLFLLISFSFGYFLLNFKRGLIIAWFLSLLLFFKLQQIEFSLDWLIFLTLIFLINFIINKKITPNREHFTHNA
jgi:hypothetical protein